MLARHLQTIAHGLILTSIMLGLIAAALWLKSGPLESTAQAELKASPPRGEGIPDAGKQRYDMIDQLTEINRHLADIDKGLRSGAYSFQVVDPKASARANKGE